MAPVVDTVRPLLIGDHWRDDAPGGLNRYVGDLHLALRDGGSDPRTIVLGPMSRPAPGVSATSTASAPLPARLAALLRLARAHRDVDVVDAHFSLNALLPVLLPFRRTPLVVHFHGPWEGESRAQGQVNPLVLSVKAAIERAVYRRADRVVVLSRAFGRIVQDRYGVAPWRVEVVRPGVDLEAFSPGDRARARRLLDLPAEGAVVLAVRRLVPRMGLGDLLDAWRSSGLADGGTLVIVGEGPERGALQRRTAEWGLTGSVRLLGKVPDATLVECYRAADVCVVPSIDLEGFGLVVLESLACGTPVAATDVGGLPEVLGELQPDLVVPPARPDLLATRLRDATRGDRPLPDPRTCRTFAERHGWPAAVERHQRLYARARAGRDRTDRLSVVYLGHCAQLSGAELALTRLLAALPEVHPHVILAEDGPLVGRLRAAGVSVEVLPLPDRARLLRRDAVRGSRAAVSAAALSAAYVARLTRRLRELRPDLVHTNSLKAALYGTLAARAAGLPVVWHAHDRIAADYLPAPAVRLVRAAARWLPSAVIANSAATRATLGAATAATVIPAPVGAPTAQAAGDRPMTVGVLGRLTPWKGQHLFLRAFAEAFPAGPQRAVLIGAALFGEEDYAAGLHNLAAQLGIGGRVEFRGFRDDVAAELARLDVLVHCSTVAEPFGQVVVEGMAAGLPVVAAGAGGPAEVIRHGADGLLYPPGDVAALAAAMRRLGADEELRRRLGAGGRRTAHRFRPAVVAEQVMGVYRVVLGRPATGVAS